MNLLHGSHHHRGEGQPLRLGGREGLRTGRGEHLRRRPQTPELDPR